MPLLFNALKIKKIPLLLVFTAHIFYGLIPATLSWGKSLETNTCDTTLENLQICRVIHPLDRVELLQTHDVFDKNIYHLEQIYKSSLNYEKLKSPWSIAGWSMENGLIAGRPKDSNFTGKSNPKTRAEYIARTSLAETLKLKDSIFSGKKTRLKNLSPSEQYELLVGDIDSTLTHSIWDFVVKKYNQDSLSWWMGMCEGKSAASAILPEPKKSLTFKSRFTHPNNGEPVTFTIEPGDIKALASYLFSDVNALDEGPSRRQFYSVIGFPNADLINFQPGRTAAEAEELKEKAENDNNPGTWHIAVLNRLKVHKKYLIIDYDKDSPVWNGVVAEYEYEYFNPLHENVRSKTLNENVLIDVSQDPLNQKRAPNARSLVGVKMRVGMSNSQAGRSDGLIHFDYTYDLELTSDGLVVGGEWWPNSKHPDFIWVVPDNFFPLSIGEKRITNEIQNWPQQGQEIEVPQTWLDDIRLSSESRQLFAEIIYRLVEMSSGEKINRPYNTAHREFSSPIRTSFKPFDLSRIFL